MSVIAGLVVGWPIPFITIMALVIFSIATLFVGLVLWTVSAVLSIKHQLSRAAPIEFQERVFVNVTPEFLMGLYKDHTNVQGELLVAPYVNKWIKVSGPFGNLRPLSNTGKRKWAKSEYTSTVKFAYHGIADAYHWMNDVYMHFNEDWFGRLNVVQINKNISVEGQIIEVNRTNVELWNCELVDLD